MGSILPVSMKCLILLAAAAAVVSYVLADADPSADAQYYGASLLPHHQYLGGLPYQLQPHFVTPKTDEAPATSVKLVSPDVSDVSSSPIIPAGYGLPYGYAGAGLHGYPGYGNLGHVGYGHGYGYGYAPQLGYGGLGYPYGTF